MIIYYLPVSLYYVKHVREKEKNRRVNIIAQNW